MACFDVNFRSRCDFPRLYDISKENSEKLGCTHVTLLTADSSKCRQGLQRRHFDDDEQVACKCGCGKAPVTGSGLAEHVSRDGGVHRRECAETQRGRVSERVGC